MGSFQNIPLKRRMIAWSIVFVGAAIGHATIPLSPSALKVALYCIAAAIVGAGLGTLIRYPLVVAVVGLATAVALMLLLGVPAHPL